MLLVVKGSFYRDWKKIGNKELSRLLKVKISEIETASRSSQIGHLKKLRNYSARYKIELKAGNKIFWVLCIVKENKIELLRLKSEIYFKKNL